jgi:hypothetical protein
MRNGAWGGSARAVAATVGDGESVAIGRATQRKQGCAKYSRRRIEPRMTDARSPE